MKHRKAAHGKTQATVMAGAHIGGTLEVPGDKSISHRVAILSSLARGSSKVIGYLQCEDCVNTLRGLEQFGAASIVDEEGDLVITGTGGRFHEAHDGLYLGNSGTGIRLLAGIAAGLPFGTKLAGDDSLSQRPMRRVCDPLEKMGATVTWLGEPGFPPMSIRGGELKAIDYTLPVASAQVKSCLLLATLFADGVSLIHEPRATRDHTERLMRVLQIPVEVEGLTIRCPGYGDDFPDLEPQEWYVPGDFSSAAFWMVAVAGREDRTATLQNVGLNPRRTALLDVLRRMGAEVEVEPVSDPADVEPYGDIKIKGAKLKATEVKGGEIPNLIDELPLVAVLGALAEGETVIADAKELRVKESDRIATMVRNLKHLSVDVEEREDGMIIRGPAKLAPRGVIDSHGDHRIAMAMAVLGLYSPEPVTVRSIACTETSYPGFWYDLHQLGGQVEF